MKGSLLKGEKNWQRINSVKTWKSIFPQVNTAPNLRVNFWSLMGYLVYFVQQA